MFENEEPVIYRLGSLTIEEIQDVVGDVIVKNEKEENPDAPGMLKKHYSPKTKTVFTDNISNEINNRSWWWGWSSNHNRRLTNSINNSTSGISVLC